MSKIKSYISDLIEEFDKTAMLSNFVQGQLWRGRMKYHTEKTVLPIFFYFDEFQAGNLNGSQTLKIKISGCYERIPCLSPEYVSKFNFIFVTLLFYGKD